MDMKFSLFDYVGQHIEIHPLLSGNVVSSAGTLEAVDHELGLIKVKAPDGSTSLMPLTAIKFINVKS